MSPASATLAVGAFFLFAPTKFHDSSSSIRFGETRRTAAALDEYVEAAELDEPRATLFQSVDRPGERVTGRPLTRRLVLAMIKRRAAAAGLPSSTCCHTFRATGITAYLSNGGTLEHAQQIAGHASPKTTKLYDRTADTVTVDEIERIVI